MIAFEAGIKKKFFFSGLLLVTINTSIKDDFPSFSISEPDAVREALLLQAELQAAPAYFGFASSSVPYIRLERNGPV